MFFGKCQLSFQKLGVNIINTENISRRPISISMQHVHLANTGNSFQDIVGPISRPNVGPTLLNVDIVIVMAFVWSIPAVIITNAHTRHNIQYTERNPTNVIRR